MRGRRSLAQSLRDAAAGLLWALRTQRNLRIHLLLGGLVLLCAFALGLSRGELALLCLVVGLVVTAELLNTAVEAAVDLHTPERDPLAAVAKNVAAGGVLAAALTSLAAGYFLFFERLAALHGGALRRTVSAPAEITGAALILVLLAAVGIKVRRRHWRLAGGLPSAHAAVAFSLATSIFFLGASGPAVVLGGLLALLVGQSRVEGGLHRPSEVVAGAVLGVLATTLLFQLLP